MTFSENNFKSDSCAVGGAFNPEGGNIRLVLEFLKKLPHRGGQIFTKYKDEVIKVGDGAGVNCSIDRNYYNGLVAAPAEYENYGIGNFFLPLDETAREIARQKIKEICDKYGVRILNNSLGEEWRKIKFDSPEDSESAKDLKLQKFEQVFLAPKDASVDPEVFEKVLGDIHREVEKYAYELGQQFDKSRLAVASLSCKRVIYKGMLLPHEVEYFEDLRASNPTEVIYHIRQSTNVSPSPGNAQPFMVIAHNGELNSVEGNADKDHRLPRGFSDSRTFDENLRELLSQGKHITEAFTILMPPPKTGIPQIDAMIEETKITGQEYNGPAHMVFSSGNIKGAKLDSSALRPSRYLVAQNRSGQNCLYIGSEDMFSETRLAEMGLVLVERGMLKAGEMIIIEDNVIKKNEEILLELAGRIKERNLAKPSVRRVDEIVYDELVTFPTQRLNLGARELEIKKYQLLPLIAGATKKIAMGDDTNPMKVDEADVTSLADHFKQKFSQVSSPPLDSDKEAESFSLISYLGNRQDESFPVLEIQSPILKVGELEAIETKVGGGAVKIDLSLDLSDIPVEDREDKKAVLAVLRKKIDEICYNVEAQVRAGKSIIILNGSTISPERLGLPDILVTAAVYSHLHEKGLEKQASLIVNSAQMESAHHFSVLSALGAAAVNPAGAYDFAAELAQRESDADAKYKEYCDNFQHAVEKAHLVTMAKYGISSAQVYAGSRLIETMTINLKETSDEYDPSCLGAAFKSVKSCGGFTGKFGVDDILTNAVIEHQRRYDNKIITSGHFAYTPSGVSHSYNPAVIGAIRGITTAYRTKRSLVEKYLETAHRLENKKAEILSAPDFELGGYKAILEASKLEKRRMQVSFDRTIARLENQNDKLINSLFFIDGIVKALENVAERQKSKDIEDIGFSLNEIQIRQFLSVDKGAELASVTSIFRDYKKGAIEFEDVKAALFTKAGYDASEVGKIEEWTRLVKEEKSVEAAKVFAELSEHNQAKIRKVYQKQRENQDGIDALKARQITQCDQTIDNLMIAAAETEGVSDRDSYFMAIDSEIEKLRKKAAENNLLPEIVDGAFLPEAMDAHQVDKTFKDGMAEIVANKHKAPVTIADHLQIDYSKVVAVSAVGADLQSVSNIAANCFVTGGMSHGALTLPAHQDVAKAARLIGSKSCTGEGGKPEGQIAKMIQIASGRFGINPEYFADADIVEIKVVQGAKPGEGGMLPDGKVSVEIAAIRGANPGFGLISPPPHHDIYSIEDLQQLIHDLKEFKPGIKVSVKLCASEGIDQIAIGVAKSGADIINIASGSGGTGAAAIDSIKSTGLPSEVGLVMVHQALSKAGIRPLVKLQTSGFPNTPEGVIMMAILGGDILESGTIDVMLLGCDMHRKCNIPGACGPGITNNAAGYQGHAEDLALYKLNLAKAVQEKLVALGVNNLSELRGRTELLNPENLVGKVSDEFIQSLLAESLQYEQLPEHKLEEYRRNANEISNKDQYDLFVDYEPSHGRAVIDAGELDVVNRTFGANLAYKYYQELAGKAADHLTIKTSGTAGQSHGALNVHGMCLEHTGSAQDGFGKSMSGGILVVKQPESEAHLQDSIYVGNAALYGASNGQAFIPSAGSRCAVLMKGATLVVNGNIGDYGCEYMTSGSFVALGKVGKHFGSGMSGGIAALYDDAALTGDVRYAGTEEAEFYFEALRNLLAEDFARTGSRKARAILNNFKAEKSNFKIVIPKNLDKINSLEKLEKVRNAFEKRRGGIAAISPFEKIWLETKEIELQARAVAVASSAEVLVGDEAVELQSDFSRIALAQQDKMRQYGPLGARIVGGLGVPDQVLSDDIGELMSELFNHGKKCSCDAVTCTSSQQRKEKLEPKHPSSGCPLAKNPNLINGILNDKSLSELERAKQAFMMQVKESPYAGFTGSACPAPCQDSCTHSASDDGNDEAVRIKRVELILHKIALLKGWYEDLEVFAVKPQEAYVGKRVMIVGSGPSAFEAAYQMAKKGIKVHVFEKNLKVGGLLRYGIPDHKLQKETIDFYAVKLAEMGVEFHTGVEIDIASIKETYPDFDLYLDGRGIAQTPVAFDRDFPRTNFAEGGNHFMAMDFLRYCNDYFAKEVTDHPFVKFNLGDTVVVLGSGDTAEDVKRSILKLNAESGLKVKLITINRQSAESERAKLGSDYPKSRETLSGDLRQEVMVSSAVEHHDDTTPKSFILDGARISGIKCNSTFVVEGDFARPYRDKKSQEIGAEFVVSCDSVITALGFGVPEFHYDSVRDYSVARELKDEKPIIPIGDMATKSGFANDFGSQLIVSAQASAKHLVDQLFPDRPSASVGRKHVAEEHESGEVMQLLASGGGAAVPDL